VTETKPGPQIVISFQRYAVDTNNNVFVINEGARDVTQTIEEPKQIDFKATLFKSRKRLNRQLQLISYNSDPVSLVFCVASAKATSAASSSVAA
jgi:hypothetical protein